MIAAIRAHEADGWVVKERSPRGHWVVLPPKVEGQRSHVIQVPCTPSDWRAFKNVRASLYRAGWHRDWPLG